MIRFRAARREDVPAVVALLADDMLGRGREQAAPDAYLAAFDRMQAEGANHLIVGEEEGAGMATAGLAATYQLTFISGLSLAATRRAQIESVRVAARLRGQGVGQLLIADAEARARAAGCALIQLTMDARRSDSHRFYERLGFVPSHTGFKRRLD